MKIWKYMYEQVTINYQIWDSQQVQLFQSSGSKCADPYCEEDKQIFIILLCTIVLKFPDEVPIGKIFLQICGN